MGIASFKNVAVIIPVAAFGWCSQLWAKCNSKPTFHPSLGTYLNCIVEQDGKQTIFEGTQLSLEDCKAFCNKRCNSALDSLCITPTSSVPDQISQAEEIVKLLKLKENTRLQKQINRGDSIMDFKAVATTNQNSQTVSNGYPVTTSNNRLLMSFRRMLDKIKNRNPKVVKYQVATSDNKVMTSFHTLFEEMKKRYSKNPCRAAKDKAWLRERSLVLMNEALALFEVPTLVSPKADDATDDDKFNNAMVNKWRGLISLLANNPNALPRVSKEDKVAKIEKTTGYVRDSLKKGVIPLPHFLEETLDNQNHFSYTSLSQYFFYGIAPISLKMTPQENLLKRPEHPLRHSLLSSVFDLMDHDLQHSSKIISRIYEKHKIQDRKQCEKFFNCVDKIPNIKDKKKSKNLRFALFYLLHEDSGPMLSKLGDDFHPLEFAEYSLERLMNNNKKFNIQELIGTGIDREKFCAAVRAIQSSVTNVADITVLPNEISEDPLKKIDDATSFLSNIFPANLENTFQSQMSKIINKRESTFIEESKRTINELRHVSVLKRSFLRSLEVTCSLELNKIGESKTQNASLDEAKSYLSSRFKIWEENNFHNEFQNASKNLATSIRDLIDSFEKNRKCRDILRRQK